MREVSRTSTGIWYETDSGFFVQLPYPRPLPRLTAAEQLEWGFRYLRERYGPPRVGREGSQSRGGRS